MLFPVHREPNLGRSRLRDSTALPPPYGRADVPRYFLHLRDGTDQLLDPEGIVLPNLDALRAKVLQSARDTMSHDLKTGHLELKWRIEAEDEDGQVVHCLPFPAAVKITDHDLEIANQ